VTVPAFPAAAAAVVGFLLVSAAPLTGQINGGQGSDVRPMYPIDPETAPRPALRALRVAEALRIDGRLDEPAWASADSAADWITALPRDGYPASERSVARVLYDDDYLYVGAYLYDSAPQRLYSPGLEQDFPTHDADLFGVVLDTYLDRQNGVMFAVSPAGALFDAQSFNDSREVNTAWEGVIEVRTAIHADGWSAEMAIPLRTLRFTAVDGAQEWGINFLRRVRRINEDSYWAPVQRQFRVHKMSRAGTLTGLDGLRQGRNLAVKPYVKAASVAGAVPRTLGQTGADVDAGLDVKYGVTSRLTLDVTTFTDFSQVEVDQEQVNLTRFSLFFPEKRDFFLENDGIFTLGDVTERNTRTGSGPRDFKLFYSRSIGLSADRRPIPILGGVRLSGRAGATEIGVLDMQTRAAAGAPAENFAVLRLRQNFGATADAGVLMINRQATGGDTAGAYNRSIGIDANLRLLRYLLINTYLAATADPAERGDATSAYVQAAWRDRLWNISAFAKHVGEGFNPKVGFIRRQGVRQAFGTVGVHAQPPIPAVAEVNPFVDVSAIETVDGVLETRWLKSGLAVTFEDGGTLSLEYEDRFERLFENAVVAGADVPPGDYAFGAASLAYQSSGARTLSGTATLSRGDFYDGDRTSITAALTFRPSPHLALEASAEHNDLTLTGRSFRADVFGGRLRYAASTRFFASAFVQYVESSEELVSNIRLNYIHAPLSDVFVVLTNRSFLDGRGTAERVLTVKATRLVAF
jgi:hypothetical protein